MEVLAALTAHVHQNALNVLLETKLEHLVSLVENDRPHVGEVNVAPLDVVEHAASGSHKNVDTAAQLTRLVLDWHAAVDCEGVVLVGRVLN